MNFEIKRLEPSVLDDFLLYFDEIGFTDNPEWGGCYCHFYHFEGERKDWGKRTGEANRDASINLINSRKMSGFLVYEQEKPIGWCNANIKENYHALISDAEINYEKSEKIASIVCFLIAPDYRRKGIAGKLLYFIAEINKIKLGLKVLIMSGDREDERIGELLSLGCIGFMPKPFSVEMLDQKIRENLCA